MTPAMRAYLILLDDYTRLDDDDGDDASLAALDAAWAVLSPNERESIRDVFATPETLTAAVTRVRRMLEIS